MIKIAIYGKGGIGKSTTAANLAVAISEKGFRVMQIGCDPKSDSTKMLMHGRSIPTVLDQIREKTDVLTLEDIVFEGYNKILCVEAGGPTPGVGCAGRGIITAFDKLEELNANLAFSPDVVLYDVLGDVVCGGFAMPIRDGYADVVYIVTSGEIMSLYAAGNIITAINSFSKRKYAQYGGLILNCRNVENENQLVENFAAETEGEIVGIIPRDSLVQSAENLNGTVLEYYPDSDLSKCYRLLAENIMETWAHAG